MKRNNPLRAPYLLSITLATISGCTPYSESFDCPPGRGVGCKSLSVINQMVEEGKLPLEGNSIEETPSEQGLIQAQNTHVPHSLLKSSLQMPPSPNTHMKVWLVGYEDKQQGIIHEASTIYVALKKDPSPQIELSPVRNN